MKNIIERLKVPKEVQEIFNTTNVVWANSREDLFKLALGIESGTRDYYEVYYTIQGIGKVVECTVAKCKNGLAVNYTDSYMRRRDPNCMVIADEKPTDKETFINRFGESFDGLRKDTLKWFRELDTVIAMPFMSGGKEFGYPSLVFVPANAAFFAAALGDIQDFIPCDEVEDGFEPKAIMYVAPPFRHTYFGGKQVVVHNRKGEFHEIFSYNLYPGPSAKKGVYSVLLDFAEKDNWNTLHASTVKVTTPYENRYNIMHEGASGGGKSEMLENTQRESDGRILLGESIIDGNKIHIDLLANSEVIPVTDDMALAHPKLQNSDKLTVTDAESGWFLRVDHIKEYGTERELERMTIHPKAPMLFFNIDASPKSTALIWEHIMDAPGKPCSNPRVIVPKDQFNAVKGEVVEIDLRSFGLRTPPTTKDNISYGVVGLFHVLPPAIAWLWRLVAPRGFANPSITFSDKMESEGVGSYWPFATGKRVDQANILLRQMEKTPGTRYVLIPNQYIGCYKVGFKAEHLSREYLSRRGQAPFKIEELINLGSPVLGYAMKNVKLDGKEIPSIMLNVAEQRYVGEEAFKAGADILTNFFKKELEQFLTPDLDPLGKIIIESFIAGESIEALNAIMPGKYIK
ncbi:MAG: hypothetical protein FD141_1396 [Fusobacteria bacterium]|nr:MAG: hypothetical protein FD141_1396 [Fusobacteriota bacterium]KAF0230109.1 MAG: hypothetical protein FD182_499 [Fusobacteriota bacterium]